MSFYPVLHAIDAVNDSSNITLIFQVNTSVTRNDVNVTDKSQKWRFFLKRGRWDEKGLKENREGFRKVDEDYQK
jgi:hypothetical protein